MGKARERREKRREGEDLKVQAAYDEGETHYNGRRIIPGLGLGERITEDKVPVIVPTVRAPRNPKYQPK